jgi:hypothetical protein
MIQNLQGALINYELSQILSQILNTFPSIYPVHLNYFVSLFILRLPLEQFVHFPKQPRIRQSAILLINYALFPVCF